MGSQPIHDEPSDTDAEAGAVIVDGPDGVAVTLTPGAAKETGKRLQESAAKAQDQRDGKRPPFDTNAGAKRWTREP